MVIKRDNASGMCLPSVLPHDQGVGTFLSPLEHVKVIIQAARPKKDASRVAGSGTRLSAGGEPFGVRSDCRHTSARSQTQSHDSIGNVHDGTRLVRLPAGQSLRSHAQLISVQGYRLPPMGTGMSPLLGHAATLLRGQGTWGKYVGHNTPYLRAFQYAARW
jgi:hypothetical protein